MSAEGAIATLIRFQFLNGTIKREYLEASSLVFKTFQFLNGTIKSRFFAGKIALEVNHFQVENNAFFNLNVVGGE